jgi:hypothetical protein
MKWERELEEQRVSSARAAKDATIDFVKNGLDFMTDYMEKASEATMDMARGFLDQAEVFEDAMAQTTGAERRQLQAQAEASREQAQMFKKEAYKQWDASIQLAAAKIELDGIIMGIELATSMAALGPFGIAAGIGLAAATTGLALQQVYSQEPPEFPAGLTPDHTRVVAVQPEEAILNRRATRELGPENVSSLNQGRGLNRESDDTGLVEAIWALARSREHRPRVKRIGKRPRR